MQRIVATIQEGWYRPPGWNLVLLPLAWVFAVLVCARRLLYRWGVLPTWHAPVPLIMVGNIVAGGSGKTPVVLAIAEFLRDQGFRPGLVSRGYGGHPPQLPYKIGRAHV